MSAQTTKQRLALAIIDFLNKSTQDGTLAADDAESIEIATNCICEAFKVDASSPSTESQSLLQIYSVYERMKSAATPKTEAKTESSSAPTDEQKKQADALKSKGNAAMAQKDYPTAIDYYTQALAIIPGNPIFLSNRAAAYSASKDHESAKADAEAAVTADPSYTKAWSRLGLANFALGDVKGSMEAYEQGIEHEGNGGSEAMKRGYETAKKRYEQDTKQEVNDDELPSARNAGGAPGGGVGAGGMPDLSALAGMFGGGGAGGAGGGGMPDLSSIMSNPMFASMAQNLMSNPDMMNNIMSNPAIRNMASQLGGSAGGAPDGGAGAGGQGGGTPDIASLMQDPSIAEM